MSEFNKYSTDGGATFIDVEDSNAVHWADNAVLGAVNLFPIDISTLKSKNTAGTWSGNTYTLNSLTLDCEVVDGYVTTITANGTPTTNVNFIIFDGNSTTELANKLKGKSITLSGCPINGSSSSYRMLFSTWGSVPNEYDDGSGCTVNVPSNVSGLRFDCIVYSGYTANNIVFKPMLAISPNAVYAPYAMTNKELTDIFTNKITGFYAKRINLPANSIRYITAEFGYQPIFMIGQRNLGLLFWNLGSSVSSKTICRDADSDVPSITFEATKKTKITNNVNAELSFLVLSYADFTLSAS